MAASAWSVPRLIKNNLTKNLRSNGFQLSPNDLLSKFPQASMLTVKKSSTSRFFMYEEHAAVKIQDDQVARTFSASPIEFASLLNKSPNSTDPNHYYWTSPISDAAPSLLEETFGWYKQLHEPSDMSLLDPRGPSLWMGTSGSGTQCHYDVANNVILQLYGSKRIRCFHPSLGVSHLHVFPDAHPRARKSQADFDAATSTTPSRLQQFPHFENLPPPTLDVTLRPGDALEIPAFWFHHVENGKLPNSDDGDDKRSVSLNSFVVSQPMMIAQQIFQQASQPLRGSCRIEQVPPTLKELGISLLRGLDVGGKSGQVDFIRRSLLEARYLPLENLPSRVRKGTSPPLPVALTEDQLTAIEDCISRILPHFEDLLMVHGSMDERNGIVLLVALHVLELWAVELVGAPFVSQAWKEALQHASSEKC
eukprot:scaffold2334_cov118-Cylindrotheca_fusiformis.AAC.13